MSHVVLVHGLGGSGKSRLLRHFRDMADGRLPDSPVTPGGVRTVWLDWEDEHRHQPTRYAGIEGPKLTTVLDAVQKAVVAACGKDRRVGARARRAFDAYRQGAAQMPEYSMRFADVLTRSQRPGSPFTSEDVVALLKLAASAGLTTSGHPSGVLGLVPDQLAASAKAVGHLSVAVIQALTGKKAGEISPEEYDLVTDPTQELIHRAAIAVRTIARRVPLVILLDTGEIIGGRAWGWLRRVMAQTGHEVTWVVGARFETEAETSVDSQVAQFVQEIGNEHLHLMSPTRFDDRMIREYLQIRTPDRTYSESHVDMIARFTRGLPLAVSFSAELFGQGHQVENVCRKVDEGHPSTVVSQLARRYLIHAEHHNYPDSDPHRDDVWKILGLALAFGDLRSDPDLLARLWNVSDSGKAIQDLAQRHDFVQPVSCRLHDDVRDILRTDLLEPFRRTRICAVNRRALDLLNTRLEQLRDRWPTLDEQFSHTRFTTALLAKLWHTLWVDNQAGLDLFVDLLPVLAVADSASADAAASLVETFTSTFDEDQRRDLDLFTTTQPTSDLDGQLANQQTTAGRPSRRLVIRTLSALALHHLSLPQAGPSALEPADRRIAVMILQARQRSNSHDDEGAIAVLQVAASQTTSTRLRHNIGAQAHAIANRLIWSKESWTSAPTAAGMSAAQIAAETLDTDESAWHAYAVALRELGRLDDAVAAHDRALALNPNYSDAVKGRGISLRRLGRLNEALAAYDQALALNPDDVEGLNNRGVTLTSLGRLNEALAAYDQAVALNPDTSVFYENKGVALAMMGRLVEAMAMFDTAESLTPIQDGESQLWAGAILWHQGDVGGARDRFARVEGRVAGCSLFHTIVMEAIALCGLGQAGDAKQRVLDAWPLRAPGDRLDQPHMLFDLLSDPPLSGIENLRTILDSGPERRTH